MTEQPTTTEQQTVTINGYEEEARGWAVYDETNERWVAVYACTHEDWSNDAEAPDEAPSLEHAVSIVSGGSADDGSFLTGDRDQCVATIRDLRRSPADKLMRNMLALLDSVVNGEVLNDPMLADEKQAREALLVQYAQLRAQLAVTFAHPLDTPEDVRAFLLATEDWEV